VKLRKMKNTLIKDDVTRDISMSGGDVKAFVTFMKATIPKKNTLFRPKF
jgi:hypothetical protein